MVLSADVSNIDIPAPDINRDSLVQTQAREKLPSVLEDLGRVIDGQYIWRSFKVEPKVKWCKPKTALTKVPGIVAHIIEPNIIAELTREYLRLEFLQLDLGGSFKFARMGKVNEDQGAAYSHMFRFPILGKILKKATNGFICFEQGSLSVLSLSEFDPSAWNSILRLQVIPTLRMLLNPEAVFYGVASCASGVALNHMSPSSRVGKTGDALRSVIDTIYYNNGCNGMKTVGAHITTNNPFTSALNISMAQIDMVTMDTYMLPQTVLSIVNGWDDDLYCKPNIGMNQMINSQYQAQLLRPRLGKPFITASTPAEWASFKNDGTTQGNSVFFIWQKRDFAMGAYACSKAQD
jgi:hypothetical protein